MDQDTPLIARPQRTDLPWLAALMLVTAGLALVVARRMVDGPGYSDYVAQIALAESMARTHSVLTGAFLYHLTTIVLHAVLLGRSFAAAGKVAAVVFAVLQSVLTYVVVRPASGPAGSLRGAALAAGLALTLFLVSPITIPNWPWHNLYDGYIALAVYDAPTVNALRPLALALTLVAVRIGAAAPGRRRPWVLVAAGGLAVLAALAKPIYSVYLLVALALVVGYRLVRRGPVDWPLALSVAAPLVVVMAWQYFFTFGASSAFAFAPLRVMLQFTPPESLLPKLLLSLTFPLVAYGAYWRVARRDAFLNLGWLTLLVALAGTYLLSETGSQQFQGEFLRGAQVAAFIVFVASVRLWLVQWRAAAPEVRWAGRHVVLAAILSLHLVSGLLWYYLQATRGAGTWL